MFITLMWSNFTSHINGNTPKTVQRFIILKVSMIMSASAECLRPALKRCYEMSDVICKQIWLCPALNFSRMFLLVLQSFTLWQKSQIDELSKWPKTAYHKLSFHWLTLKPKLFSSTWEVYFVEVTWFCFDHCEIYQYILLFKLLFHTAVTKVNQSTD